MDISMIFSCNSKICAYNTDGNCHTVGITIGPHAECRTFVCRNTKAGFSTTMGVIAACQAADCSFNQDLECHASLVNVDGNKPAGCSTFYAKVTTSV